MTAALSQLDQDLPKNVHVRILKKGNCWISVSPLEAQPEPVNLVRLKAKITQRWAVTSLLDVLKEADLRIEFLILLNSDAGQ